MCALRSVLDIDIDDSKFREFHGLFEKYQTALDKMPGAWGKVSDAAGKAKSEYADIAASLLAMIDMMTRTNRQADSFERHLSGSQRSMSGLAREARDVARHLSDATRSLLRWTGISAAAGGLLGFGSVFGLERIGQWSDNLRRSSSGLGFAPGNAVGQQSFRTNLSRLVDPNMFLGGVNTAMNDASQRWTLSAAGLGENQIRGRDTGQVSLSLLQSAWRTIQAAPEGQLQQVIQARGLDRFMGLQDATRLKQTPYNELQEFLGLTRKDTRGNAITDEDLKRWQDFNVALDRAGNTLWNTIVTGLAPLAEPLKSLSGGFTDVAKAFLDSPYLRRWIDEASVGLKDFAGYVGSEAFAKDTREFVGHVGEFAQGVEEFGTSVVSTVKWIKSKIPDEAGAGMAGGVAGGVAGAWLGRMFGPWGAAIGGALGFYAGSGGSQQGPPRSGESMGGYRQRMSGAGSPDSGAAPSWVDRAKNWLGIGGGSGRTGELNQQALEAISRAEGTFGEGGINYNKVFGGGTMNLTGMTLAEVMKYQQSAGGAAAGAFQQLPGTISDMAAKLGLDPNVTKYSPEVQRQLASQTWRAQGAGAWSGFRMHPNERRLFDQQISGAYGVPGAVMNYGAAGGVGAPGTNLVQLKDRQGNSYTVNKAAAGAFRGFLDELEGTGYKVHSLGGYNMRNKTGSDELSEHAYGTAIDVNPEQNPYGSSRTNLPPGVSEMAARHGLVWGGNWKRKPDPMHFQYGGPGVQATPAMPHVTVKVENQTGGNAGVSASQVATP